MNNRSLQKAQFQDLKELHLAILNCRRCQEKGKQVTNIQPPWDPSRGRHHMQKWGMWIGQAPGLEEKKRAMKVIEAQVQSDEVPRRTKSRGRIAFSGDAGQRFQCWLLDAGLSEEEIRTHLHKTAIINLSFAQTDTI